MPGFLNGGFALNTSVSPPTWTALPHAPVGGRQEVSATVRDVHCECSFDVVFLSLTGALDPHSTNTRIHLPTYAFTSTEHTLHCIGIRCFQTTLWCSWEGSPTLHHTHSQRCVGRCIVCMCPRFHCHRRKPAASDSTLSVVTTSPHNCPPTLCQPALTCAHTSQVVRLRHNDNDTWEWDTDLPPFPYAVQSAGVTSLGTVVYAVGGCDYDRKAFYCRCATRPQLSRKCKNARRNGL